MFKGFFIYAKAIDNGCGIRLPSTLQPSLLIFWQFLNAFKVTPFAHLCNGNVL